MTLNPVDAEIREIEQRIRELEAAIAQREAAASDYETNAQVAEAAGNHMQAAAERRMAEIRRDEAQQMRAQLVRLKDDLAKARKRRDEIDAAALEAMAAGADPESAYRGAVAQRMIMTTVTWVAVITIIALAALFIYKRFQS